MIFTGDKVEAEYCQVKSLLHHLQNVLSMCQEGERQRELCHSFFYSRCATFLCRGFVSSQLSIETFSSAISCTKATETFRRLSYPNAITTLVRQQQHFVNQYITHIKKKHFGLCKSIFYLLFHLFVMNFPVAPLQYTSEKIYASIGFSK